MFKLHLIVMSSPSSLTAVLALLWSLRLVIPYRPQRSRKCSPKPLRTFSPRYQIEGINLNVDSGSGSYRSASHSQNINPNMFMCFIKTLAKRVQKKADLSHINPLVDLVNAVSLKHFVFIDVHVIDQLVRNSIFSKLPKISCLLLQTM